MDDGAITAQLQKSGWAQDQIQSLLYGAAAPQQMGTPGSPAVSQKHRRMGILFIVLPFAALMLILLAWAIVVFALGQSAGTSTDDTSVVAIIQWALGFLGLLAVMSIFILVPLGIYFLNKKTVLDYSGMDSRSGKGEQSVIPAEISGWNWGAALLTWIWGIGNSVWLSLIVFLPLANLFWWIVLGINGNEWAWKARAWGSIEEFQETQRTWARWGLIIFGISFGITAIGIIFAIVSYDNVPVVTP